VHVHARKLDIFEFSAKLNSGDIVMPLHKTCDLIMENPATLLKISRKTIPKQVGYIAYMFNIN